MKRKHKDTTRLTARERADTVCAWWVGRGCVEPSDNLRDRIQDELQAHARQALARRERREPTWAAIAKQQLQEGHPEREYAALIKGQSPTVIRVKRPARRAKGSR